MPQLIERRVLKEFHAILWTVQDCGKSIDVIGDCKKRGSKSEILVEEAIAIILYDNEIRWNTFYLVIKRRIEYLKWY